MSKKNLIDKISKSTGLTKVSVASVINAIPGVLLETLETDGRALIPGIGIARIKTRPAGNFRNPKTGDKVFANEKQKVVIKASKNFILARE